MPAAPDGVQWLMAASGLLVGAGGLALSRRGQRDDKTQTEAAQRLAERVQKSHDMEALLDRTVAALERADRELADERLENDRRSHEQANRCRAALMSAMDTVHTLQAIVRDEVAVEAARTAGDNAATHLREDHPDDEPEDR